MKKSKKIAVSTVLLLSMLTTVVCAFPEVVLGQLSCWWADEDAIRRMKASPKVAWQIMSSGTFKQNAIDSYTEYGVTQWTNNGMPMSETGDFGAANVYVYAGKFNAMRLIDSDLTSGEAGHTLATNLTEEGMWERSRFDHKYGYANTRSKIVVAWDNSFGTTLYPGNEAIYKNVILHELGHALGWYGHASGSHVMNKAPSSSRLILTERDVNHVKQVKGY